MQFDGVLIDARELAPRTGQRVANQRLGQPLRRGGPSRRVASRDFEIHTGAIVRIFREKKRHTAQYVFQDGHVLFQMEISLHAELRHRTATDDDGVIDDARLYQGSRVNERIHRRRAEGFHVHACRVHAARHLGDRLGEVASSAIVAIAYRLFRTTDDVLD